MRALAVAFVCVAASGGMFCDIRWPDPDIRVPPLVVEFIAAECLNDRGAAGPERATCVDQETAAYRATVTMLIEPATGATAAERYRACTGGMWEASGRFHRHKADCIGNVFRYLWRFENTTRA